MGFAGGVDSVAGDVVADRSSGSGYSRVNESGGRDPVSRADVDRESGIRSAANRDAIDKAAARKAQRAVDTEAQDQAEAQKRVDAAAAETKRQMQDATARQVAERAALNSFLNTDIIGAGISSLPTGIGGRYVSGSLTPTTTLDFKRANEILSSSQGGQYDPTSGGMIPNADMLKGYIKLSGATGDQTTTRNSMLEGFSKDYLTKMLGSLAKTSGDVSIGSARRSPEEQASIISDRLKEIDPKVAADWDKSVSEKGAIAAGQEFKDLFDIAGYFKTPGTQVAMPGSSQHQKSAAMDIAFGGDGAAREDLINRFQTTATGQGLSFPVKGEYWHAELAGDRPTQVATSPFVRDLNKTFDNIKAGVKTVADATGAGSVLDFLTNTTARNELEDQYNRDKQMSKEDMDILMFNRLHPEAGSDRERYGGRDPVLPPAPVTPSVPKTPVVPPVVPTEPVMPTVPNFAAAQQYIGTPTVATPGFNFSMPFAPRPQVDFANLGQAYAPTALPSAPPPQPLPGIPGAAYATPYQRLG